MLLAQANHEKHLNCHRSTTPQYRESSFVWLDTWNLFIKQLYQKLKNCHARLCPVKRIVSIHTIELVFLEDIPVDFVFYINLLELAATNPHYASHIQPLLPSIEIDSEAK